MDHFEDDAWEGDPVVWAAFAAADAEWAKESEGVGAVYDQDEQYDGFCGCITCDVEDEEELDTGSVSTSEISGGEFVCGVDMESDDDLVTSDYRGLRDVDGWQRRDPWGAPRETSRSALRYRVRLHLYLLLLLPLVFYLRPYILRVSLGLQRLQH